MATHTITAFFDSRAEAERASEALVSQLGLTRSAIRLDADTSAAGGTTTGSSTEGKGFLASLADLFVADDDRHTYAEGIRRGGVLLSVQAEDAQADRISDLLEQHGAVDLDARETEWRQSGWTGHAGATGGATGAVLGASSDGNRTATAAMPVTSTPDGTPGNPSGTMLSRGVDQAAGTNVSGAYPEHQAHGASATGGTATGSTATGHEESIPLAEERLRVGKRVANAGRVRVRSYVVETPVEEQVSLREEHVHVERRPVDRAASATDADLFKDRVIEAEERTEEAVVQKEVRVTGEVSVSKETTERVETVRDSVRRTEVEVDESDAANSNLTKGPGRTGSTGDRR